MRKPEKPVCFECGSIVNFVVIRDKEQSEIIFCNGCATLFVKSKTSNYLTRIELDVLTEKEQETITSLRTLYSTPEKPSEKIGGFRI